MAPTDDTVLRLGADLSIGQAAALRDTLADAVHSAPGDLQLDLSAVHDFDSSGVQLLVATRRSLATRGHALQIVAASAAVREALQLFGLTTLLDHSAMPAGAH